MASSQSTDEAQAIPDSPEHRIFGLSNVFSPAGFGQIQDYTHEREWRMFSDLVLSGAKPEFLVSPSNYSREVAKLFGDQTSVVSIDTMYEWGA